MAKWRALLKGITNKASATSAAVRVITGPSAPSSTGGGPYGFGPGLKFGGISVWVENSPRKFNGALPSQAANTALMAATVSAHPGRGSTPLAAVPLLDVRLDLGAQPEPEPALAVGLQIVGGVGHVDRAARTRDRHVRHQFETGLPRRNHQREENIVRALEGEEAIGTHLDDLPGAGRNLLWGPVDLQMHTHERSVVE